MNNEVATKTNASDAIVETKEQRLGEKYNPDTVVKLSKTRMQEIRFYLEKHLIDYHPVNGCILLGGKVEVGINHLGSCDVWLGDDPYHYMISPEGIKCRFRG